MANEQTADYTLPLRLTRGGHNAFIGFLLILVGLPIGGLFCFLSMIAEPFSLASVVPLFTGFFLVCLTLVPGIIIIKSSPTEIIIDRSVITITQKSVFGSLKKTMTRKVSEFNCVEHSKTWIRGATVNTLILRSKVKNNVRWYGLKKTYDDAFDIIIPMPAFWNDPGMPQGLAKALGLPYEHIEQFILPWPPFFKSYKTRIKK